VVEADAAVGVEADAIVARGKVPGVVVGVRVADCVPILIADPRTGDVVAIHAGWRGVVAKIVPSAVAALERGALVAAIGPCIGACCFEVGRDVAALIAAACDGSQALSVRPSIAPRDRGTAGDDKEYVDLRGAVRSQLVSAGVSLAGIEDVDGCTKHEAARFHSYRRDGAGSGRMLAAIATRR
jgi:polyphenol oxidase